MLTSLDLQELTLDPLPKETDSRLSRLLRFPLGSADSALLPLEQIKEILSLSVTQILPVPEMPSCVLGIGNWRGEMLWLIDLNNFLGYSPLTFVVGATPLAIVIQVGNQCVGLVVEQVNNIESHDLQQLHPAAIGLFPPHLLPFVLGSLPGDGGTVLNLTAITQSPLWQIHSSRILPLKN